MHDNTLGPACQEILSDVGQNGKEKPWARQKELASVLWYSYLTTNTSKAARIQNCADSLRFERGEDGRLRLAEARFCRVRLCPICQWRRSLKVYGQTVQIVRYLADERAKASRKPYAYLMLTLTVRNVPGTELRAKLDLFSKAWQRITQRAEVRAAVVGSMRTVEITYNREKNTYHPHIHALLCVKPSYFHSKAYIPQQRWLELWREAMRDPSIDQVDIRRCYGVGDKAIAEVAKYTAKPGEYIDASDLDRMQELVDVLDRTTAARRFVSWAGVMKKAHQALGLDDAEDGDLVHVETVNAGSESAAPLWFDWYAGPRVYLKRGAHNGTAAENS